MLRQRLLLVQIVVHFISDLGFCFSYMDVLDYEGNTNVEGFL